MQRRQCVDVIVRAHKNAPYLKSALESILSQTDCPCILIHVILDKPYPEVKKFLEKYILENEVTVSYLEDGNLATSMNIGLDLCNSKYVAVLDGDDEMLPTRLATQIDFMEKNPDIAASGSSFFQIDEKGELIALIDMPNSIKKSKNKGWVSSPIAHSTAIFRTEKLKEVGGYRPFFQFAEDFDVWLRLTPLYDLANLNQPLTRYRVYPNQTTATNFRRLANVQVAARISHKRRVKGRKDLTDEFTTFEDWSRRKRFNVLVQRLVLFEILLHNLALSLRGLSFFRTFYLRILLLALFPGRTMSRVGFKGIKRREK
jgi:glycosyltransferase involved in cell wall biosynthesis